MNLLRLRRGFSLIELIAVLAILSVLATAAIPLAQMSAQRLKEQELRLDLRQLRGAIDNYRRAVEDGRVAKKADETGFPRRLDDLAAGVEDQRDQNKQKIYFLRSIPTDPFAAPGVTGSESWAKRSYASPPEDPREGADVFDVHSRSDEPGLNGIPYRQW
ncbi:MAG: type II secretion system protein [Rhodocyclales bacterium]|nr:type II secretion system protein [Rhodocyclales bacterium]